MTAAELHRIVEGVPLDAWPKDVAYFKPETQWLYRRRLGPKDINESELDVDGASDLFIGSMVRWITSNAMRTVTIEGHGELGHTVTVCHLRKPDRLLFDCTPRPLVEGLATACINLAAACKAVGVGESEKR